MAEDLLADIGVLVQLSGGQVVVDGVDGGVEVEKRRGVVEIVSEVGSFADDGDDDDDSDDGVPLLLMSSTTGSGVGDWLVDDDEDGGGCDDDDDDGQLLLNWLLMVLGVVTDDTMVVCLSSMVDGVSETITESRRS